MAGHSDVRVSIIVNFCYRTIPINATIIFMRVTLKSKAGLRLQLVLCDPPLMREVLA